MYVGVCACAVSRVFPAWTLYFCKASVGVVLTSQLGKSCCLVKQWCFTMSWRVCTNPLLVLCCVAQDV